MAVGIVQVLHPSGSRVFHDAGPGLISVKYAITGDGVGATVNAPYDQVTRLLYSRGGSPTVVVTDDPTNRLCTVVVPAALANGKIIYLELIGQGQ